MGGDPTQQCYLVRQPHYIQIPAAIELMEPSEILSNPRAVGALISVY